MFRILFALLFSMSALANDRVEQLFLWKISEELKLSVKEEKEITSFIQELNQKKSSLNKDLDSITAEFKDAKNKEPLLKKYRSLLVDYNQISLNELDGVQKILGKTKAMQYLYLKNDFTMKIKSIFSASEKEKKTTLPDPKVIEE